MALTSILTLFFILAPIYPDSLAQQNDLQSHYSISNPLQLHEGHSRLNLLLTALKQWITAGNHRYLRLPITLSPETYETKMLEALDRTEFDFVDDELKLQGLEKTCISDLNHTQYHFKTRCNLNGFLNSLPSQQASLIHHEIAVQARIEINSGRYSNYSISGQITDLEPSLSQPNLRPTFVPQNSSQKTQTCSEKITLRLKRLRTEFNITTLTTASAASLSFLVIGPAGIPLAVASEAYFIFKLKRFLRFRKLLILINESKNFFQNPLFHGENLESLFIAINKERPTAQLIDVARAVISGDETGSLCPSNRPLNKTQIKNKVLQHPLLVSDTL